MDYNKIKPGSQMIVRSLYAAALIGLLPPSKPVYAGDSKSCLKPIHKIVQIAEKAVLTTSIDGRLLDEEEYFIGPKTVYLVDYSLNGGIITPIRICIKTSIGKDVKTERHDYSKSISCEKKTPTYNRGVLSDAPYFSLTLSIIEEAEAQKAMKASIEQKLRGCTLK